VSSEKSRTVLLKFEIFKTKSLEAKHLNCAKRSFMAHFTPAQVFYACTFVHRGALKVRKFLAGRILGIP
jgi:hypothetical protein